MGYLPSEELKVNKNNNENNTISNGEYLNEVNSPGMQPPVFQFKRGSGNVEYDDFLDSIDTNENLKSGMFSGITKLESVYDNFSTLGIGASGQHIVKIKRLLNNIGFLENENINSNFDSELQSGIKKFQTYSGAILSDGLIGPETMRFLDSKAVYYDRDLGECDPDEKKDLIDKAKEKFGGEKKEEDKKWWWDDTKSDMPDINLKILGLYERYLDGEKINDQFIPKDIPGKRYTLKFYIKNNGTREKVTTDLKGTWKDNRFHTPINEIEVGMFEQLDACSDEASFIQKLEEITQQINNNIFTIRSYATGYNGHFYPSATDLINYLKDRSANRNDIYNGFL